ncbi:MAG: sulfatase-like hydrolase/transferase [Eisenbergiella sp.]
MEKRKPNLLLIMADQMHKYALGAVTPYVKTPNLDRLAAEGTLFANAYSNNPVCGPFRGILYSGRYSKDNRVQKNGQALREGEETLPKELARLGYETGFVGKLHLGADGNGAVPEKYWAGHGHFFGYQCYNGFRDQVCFYDEQGTEHQFYEHRTDVTARLGIERLDKLARSGKPFLQTIFFQAPHYPEQPSEQYERLYDGVEFPMPEQYGQIEPYTPTYSPYSPRPFALCPDYARYGGNQQEYLKLYYAMVSQIDANVGLILRELERLGIAEDTAVVFSADHGDMQGSHGMKNKCLPYERSCGISLIVKVRWPEQKRRWRNARSRGRIFIRHVHGACRRSEQKSFKGRAFPGLLSGTAAKHRPDFCGKPYDAAALGICPGTAGLSPVARCTFLRTALFRGFCLTWKRIRRKQKT